MMEEHNRFVYEKGDIEIGKTQCEFCKLYNPENENVCSAYPEGKPEEVVKNERRCPKEVSKNPVPWEE